MSRPDGLRIADVAEAAEQLASLVADGREAFDSDQIWTIATVNVPALAKELEGTNE